MPQTRPRPHRITIDLEAELYKGMQTQKAIDRLSITDRVRALLELAQEDADLAERVSRKATEMALRENSTA